MEDVVATKLGNLNRPHSNSNQGFHIVSSHSMENIDQKKEKERESDQENVRSETHSRVRKGRKCGKKKGLHEHHSITDFMVLQPLFTTFKRLKVAAAVRENEIHQVIIIIPSHFKSCKIKFL